MKLSRKGAPAVLAVVSLLAVASLILCIAAWATGNSPQSGPDRPKVTDWMQAWGSIASVFAGFAAAAAAALLILHEREQARIARTALHEDQKRRDEEQKRRQAEQVTWYLREKNESDTNLRTPVDAGQDTHGDPPEEVVTDGVLAIINNSHNCIYEAIASIPEFHREYLKNEGLDYLARRGLGTIPPGRTEFVMPMRGYRSPGSAATRYTSELSNNRPVEYLQFKDSAGKTWRRFGQGELIEISDADAGVSFPSYSY
ncbi:hypothetical protein [Micromonospora oryzae]|uniref:hypothetical protein n=1 Tax=Micromonospora sp. DSM 102119 TaxID=3111768 RepID=UPI0031E153D9